MVQKAFVLYWSYCHLATFVLLAQGNRVKKCVTSR